MSEGNGTRARHVLERLKSLVVDLSGCDRAELIETRTFLELGFDSLFLTQLSSAFQKQFKQKITFRQLFDELPTLEAVALHIESRMPADADPAPAPVVPMRPVASAQGPQEIAPAEPFARAASTVIITQPPAGAAVTATGPDASALRSIFAEQLALMSRQLDVLAAARSSAALPAMAPQPQVQHSAITANLPSAPAAAGTAAATTPVQSAPQHKSVRDAKTLNSRQRAHLDRLTLRYNAKTAGSKAKTQAYRQYHADPRTAAGFNRQWKEMVYPIVIERSSGSHLWDVDGNRYIDILNGFGPNFLGHSPPFVTQALSAQIASGIEVGPQTPLAGEAAKLLCELTGMDRVSWVNTGSEAVQAAIRLSRTYTGRSKIVVFSGDYHGNFDEVLVRVTKSAGGRKTIPMAPGIPFGAVEEVLVLDYGSDEALDIIKANADEIAAVLVEPVQSRRPEFQPREFLHALRVLTEREGIVLVFDEVITGFRISPGGAQEHFGVKADLVTYGKIIGGGMPIGVVAGRARFMDTFDGGMWEYGDDSFPSAGVTFFAGTFVRHPLAIAAAHATLKYLKAAGPQLQNAVNQRTARLAGELNRFFEERGVKISIPYFASQMFIRVEEDSEFANLLFFHLRDRGIHLLEGFPSYMTVAHTDADVGEIISAFKDSVLEMQDDGVLPRPTGEMTLPGGWCRQMPMTTGQREIWIASQMSEQASCSFNTSVSIFIDGSLDEDRFNAAVIETLANHEAFSLRFAADGSLQWIDRQAGFKIAAVDLASDAALEDLLSKEARTSFDLEHGPVVRVHLGRLGPQRHVFVIYGHHIVFDGYSSEVVLREIAERYEASRDGRTSVDIVAHQYGTYVAHAWRKPDAGISQGALAHWSSVFADGTPPPFDLPTDKPRRAFRSYAGATAHRELTPELSKALKETAKARGVGMNAMLLSSFAALVSRLSVQADVVVGIPSAGQAHRELDVVGYCVNVLPIRARADLDKPFLGLVRETQKAVRDAFEHQDTSMSELVAALKVPRDPSRLPLFEVIFNYSRFFDGASMADCKISARENRCDAIFYDMFFNIIEAGDRLVIDMDYCRDLFASTTIEGWINHYIELLGGIVANPERAIGDLPLMSKSETASAAGDWNGVQRDIAISALAHDRFMAQAAADPGRIAIVCEGRACTYRQLDERSTRIARYLATLGAGEGSIVGIHLDRSVDMVAGILAVWKCGAAYVPLDPEFPLERLRYMLEDSRAGIVLSHSDLADQRPEADARFVELDTEAEAIDRCEASQLPSPARVPGSLAYILYTSGSTGKPKGVEIAHHSVVNFIESMAVEPGITATDRLLAVTTLSFDISVLEYLLPLSVGATFVIATRDDVTDGDALIDLIEEHRITMLQATPATWRLMLDSGWDGTEGLRALCGGEALPPDLASELLSRVDELWNMYGPTETTIWSSCTRIESADRITIGRPIGNTCIYVLDDRGEPQPQGIAGELWIGGAGVARGYRGNEALTQERFKIDPIADAPGARMYRTGDWARYGHDGQIEFQQRRDNQVKVRGFRIELGEIEAALAAHASIAQCVTTVREDHPGDVRLIAYIKHRSGLAATSSELRRWLRQSLPDYMIPQFFVELEAFPLTDNGKINRKALPAPAGHRAEVIAIVEPRTELERTIAAVWRDMLGVEKIAATDNFFDLGGQSLQAAQMVARVFKQSGHRIPPRSAIYETLEQLAQVK